MVDEGKMAEEKAAATAAATSPAAKKEGVDIAAAAAAGGGGDGTEEVEGEDDGEPCPKVSSADVKMNSALRATRSSPYAKPQGEAEDD
mmetsp:Transcript_673/g.942  ORF Transcript_673/g.942 Transcript_673/m.942 type:complete len:88 (+) Transcript_673:85-348(+)